MIYSRILYRKNNSWSSGWAETRTPHIWMIVLYLHPAAPRVCCTQNHQSRFACYCSPDQDLDTLTHNEVGTFKRYFKREYANAEMNDLSILSQETWAQTVWPFCVSSPEPCVKSQTAPTYGRLHMLCCKTNDDNNNGGDLHLAAGVKDGFWSSNKSGSIKSGRKAPSPLQQEKDWVRLRLRSLIMNKEMKSSTSLPHGIILAERQRRCLLPSSLCRWIVLLPLHNQKPPEGGGEGGGRRCRRRRGWSAT